MEEHLKRLGAQAVLSRESLDPLTLIETVESVLNESGVRDISRQSNRGEQAMFKNEEEKYIIADSSEIGTRLAGASRLLKILNENVMPSLPQLEQLRRLYSRERLGDEQSDQRNYMKPFMRFST